MARSSLYPQAHRSQFAPPPVSAPWGYKAGKPVGPVSFDPSEGMEGIGPTMPYTEPISTPAKPARTSSPLPQQLAPITPYSGTTGGAQQQQQQRQNHQWMGSSADLSPVPNGTPHLINDRQDGEPEMVQDPETGLWHSFGADPTVVTNQSTEPAQVDLARNVQQSPTPPKGIVETPFTMPTGASANLGPLKPNPDQQNVNMADHYKNLLRGGQNAQQGAVAAPPPPPSLTAPGLQNLAPQANASALAESPRKSWVTSAIQSILADKSHAFWRTPQAQSIHRGHNPAPLIEQYVLNNMADPTTIGHFDDQANELRHGEPPRPGVSRSTVPPVGSPMGTRHVLKDIPHSWEHEPSRPSTAKEAATLPVSSPYTDVQQDRFGVTRVDNPKYGTGNNMPMMTGAQWGDELYGPAQSARPPAPVSPPSSTMPQPPATLAQKAPSPPVSGPSIVDRVKNKAENIVHQDETPLRAGGRLAAEAFDYMSPYNMAKRGLQTAKTAADISTAPVRSAFKVANRLGEAHDFAYGQAWKYLTTPKGSGEIAQAGDAAARAGKYPVKPPHQEEEDPFADVSANFTPGYPDYGDPFGG